MSGNEIAVRAVPVPTALREVGVFVGQDTASGMAVVSIPAAVRERFNVLDPVQSFAQADPNWTPAIRVVELDPNANGGPHFYSNSSWRGKVAPTKPALELLAKAGGVLYTRTERVPRDQLNPGELFAYKATIGIRRSDGTIEEVSREKGYNEEAEREEILDGVRRAKAWENGQSTNRPKYVEGTPEFDAEARKRWLQEQRYAQGKTESKAILRAIRAAFQVPQQITPQDAAKPWLVIGYSFTPDYDDHEIKRALVAAGLNAQAAIYGPGAAAPAAEQAALPPVDLSTGEILDDHEPAAPATPPGAQQPAAPATAPGTADAGAGAPAAPPAPADAAPPAPAEPEPIPGPTVEPPATTVGPGSGDPEDIPFGEPEPVDDPPPAPAIPDPGAVEVPSGTNAGKPISEMKDTWLLWCLRNWSPDEFKAAVEQYVRADRPAVLAQWIETRARQEAQQ